MVLCRGRLRAKGTISRVLVDRKTGHTQPATTRYRKVHDVGGHSLAEVQPLTARPHQIRRHLAAIGHPVVGDGRYGDRRTNRHFEERMALLRPFVHVVRLGFPHPRTGRYITLEAPLPGDLELCLARLAERNRPTGQEDP
jgi:23S rRNA (uracil1939-C5)-methyltransferase